MTNDVPRRTQRRLAEREDQLIERLLGDHRDRVHVLVVTHLPRPGEPDETGQPDTP